MLGQKSGCEVAGWTCAGEYTIRFALRHDSVQVLEKLMDVPLRVDKQLGSEISVPVYRKRADALTGAKPSDKGFPLCAGERCAESAVHVLPL